MPLVLGTPQKVMLSVAVYLGTIRWTDPKTNRRVTFHTPIVLRTALFDFARSAVPEPFRFILGRTARVIRDGKTARLKAPFT